MMLRTTMLPLFALVFAAACGDDAVKPGTLVVHWNHGPTGATCGTRSVTTLEARALKGEDLIASAGGACTTDAKSGTLTLPDLEPGSYAIEVEAFNAAGKGTYLGTLAKQSVSEGKSVDSTDIALSQKPAEIQVDWTLPGGGRCSTAGISEVEVFLYKDASTVGTAVGDPQRVDCDTTGLEFVDLVPNPDVQLIAYGYDSAGKKVAKGQSAFFPLSEGDELEKVIALEACPGTPPVCD